jgi:hypothetical protein
MDFQQQIEIGMSKPDRAENANRPVIPRERRNGEGAASALESLKLERARTEPQAAEDRPAV